VPSLAFLCQLINRILISMIVPPLANPTLNRCAGWANDPFSSVSWPGSGFAGGTNSSNNNTPHLSVPLTPVGAHFSGARRRAQYLALLARRAQQPGPDPQVLATLSSTVDGRYPHDWSDEQWGKAVAQDFIEQLSILPLASSISSEGSKANGGAAAPGETVQRPGESPSSGLPA
jgi:hypothetical protein